MPMEKDLKSVVEELANATQILIGLTARLRRTLGVANEDAIKLEAAVDRAPRALQRLAPKQDS